MFIIMWIYSSFVYIIFSPLLFHSSVSSNDQRALTVNESVFWNTQPLTVDKEMISSVVFYSTEVLMLTCAIDGKPRPTYQWFVSTNDVMENALTIQDQSYDNITLASDRILSIDGKMTTKAYFKYIYYCSAQNSLGILETNKIIVEKVKRQSSINVRYVYNLVFQGEKIVIQCYLEPDLGPYYKFLHWEVRLKPGEITIVKETVGRYSVIHLTKYPQLHIRNVTNDDFERTKVRCKFRSNIYNHDNVVKGFFKAIERFPHEDIPHYTELKCTGETVTSTVGTNVELPWCSVPRTLNVSWYKIDNWDPTQKTEIGNTVNDTKYVMISRRYGNLLIMNVTKEDSGKYLVKCIDRRFETTFTLNVYETPSISLEPRNIRMKLSERAQFNCTATFSKSQFRWLHNGVKVIVGYDDGNIEVLSTVNTSTLTVKQVRLSSSGFYQCIVISMEEMKSLTDYRQISGYLFLTEVPPTLIRQLPRVEPELSSAQIKMSLTNPIQAIECIFAANPIPNIDWYLDSNKVPMTNVIKMSIEQDPNSIYNFITKLIINLNEMSKDENILNYAGEYQSRANNSFGSMSCSTFILMDSSLELRLPKEHAAVGEKDYLMSCYFMAMEVPQFSWDRKIGNSDAWEVMPVNHRTNLLDKGYRLLLKKVIKTEDEGIYRCHAMYDKESKIATTRLTVAYLPFLQNLPTKHDSSKIQTHICTIRSAADKPWYAWWTFTKYNTNETIVISPKRKGAFFSVYYNQKPNYKELLLPDIPKFLANYSNLGVDLVINARSHDNDAFGKFVCNVKNKIGMDQKSIEDNFLRLEFKKAPPSSSEVIVGHDLYLDCTAEASDLHPIVKWRLLKADGIYFNINDVKNEFNNRIYQFDNGTLVMRDVKDYDPPKLTCFIFPSINSKNIQSKISYIDIRVPARVKRFENEIYKISGSSFNLSCDVYGHTHNLNVSWYFRTSELQNWGSLHEVCINSIYNPCLSQYQLKSVKLGFKIQIHNRTFHTVHMEFQNAMESVSGGYKCEAKNKFNVDADQTTTLLTIISKPSIVIIDSIQKEATSTTATFEWKAPEKNGNRPILRYIITFYEMSSMANDGEQKNMTGRTIRVNNTIHSLVLDQLRPFKQYKVNIAAENEVGVGEAGTIYLRTQEDKPQKSVNNLVASSTNPHEILISWSDPDPEYQNGLINRYFVCYQVLPTGGESKTGFSFDRLSWPDSFTNKNQHLNVKCEETEKKILSVTNLPQFTDFVVQVIAFNNKGGSPPLYTKVRTLEDLPQAAPSHVTCEGQNEAIGLTWNPPGRQSINGVLIGYYVYFYQPNMYRDESDMKGISVQGRTSVVIDELKPYTTYSIQVMAVNRKGFGPPSSSVVCATKEAKPKPPDMVKVIKVNHTCIYASWLHTPSPNGIIKEYCLTGLGFDYKKQKCQSPDLSKRYNTMILCDHYGRFNSVQVFARNQFDGDFNSALRNEELNGIISIGGDIIVKEGSSVILPCETASNTIIHWKKDSRDIKNTAQFSEYPMIKILKNLSLEISSIMKNDQHSYSCYTDSDSIEYHLIVQETADGIPRTPIIDDFRVTENSIFFRWKSRGTNDMAVPITGFTINVQNLYNVNNKTVTLDEKARSFYLNNVTCGSDFLVKVSAQSGNGRSKFSESKRLRTLGSAPLIADASILLPSDNIDSHNANFNLLAFLPGENCSTTMFTIEISLTSSGSRDFNDLIFSKNISIYELENSCCFKVSGLNPKTNYICRVTAYNPAGSVQNVHFIETLEINGGPPGIRLDGPSINTFGNQTWLLMIILVIVIIVVLIAVIVGVLYILRSKEKKSQGEKSKTVKVTSRKIDCNHNRIDKQGKEDTISLDSQPSPYAVYQPEPDPKMGQIWTHQVSQKSSTPLRDFNHTDHHYNQIRYDNIPRRPMNQETRLDNSRRANSAECLSSLGNASVSGIADLELPTNIDPNDYFRAPSNHCADNDNEVFHNVRYPDFNTGNRKRMRRESENLNRHYDEETVRLMKNSNNQGEMNRSRHYEPSCSRTQPSQPQQQQQIYPLTGNSNRHHYRQQRSVPEPVAKYHQQYAYQSNRIRSSSGSGHNHPTSQTIMAHNPGSSSQVSGYGSYYAYRVPNIQPYSSSSAIRRDNEPPNNQFPSHGAGVSNYNPPQRTLASKHTLEEIDSPDEGIYTDKVIVV